MWTNALLVTAALVALLLLVAPLGTRSGLWNFEVGLRALLAVLVGGGLTALLAGGTCLWAQNKKRSDIRNAMAFACALALTPALFVGMHIAKARSLPVIHDISTDTENPPMFFSTAIVDAKRANTLDYGGTEIANQQLAAYPAVRTITSPLPVETAFEQAVATVNTLGWELVDQDRNKGRIEAIDTTFWFAFKDDIAIRIMAQGSGSRVDVRSISRVGHSDVGANAARIKTFIKQFGG